jgi:hypothetical protein
VQLDDPRELQRMKYLGRGPEFWEEGLREIPHDVLELHRAAQIDVVFDAKANQAQPARRNPIATWRSRWRALAASGAAEYRSVYR